MNTLADPITNAKKPTYQSEEIKQSLNTIAPESLIESSQKQLPHASSKIYNYEEFKAAEKALYFKEHIPDIFIASAYIITGGFILTSFLQLLVGIWHVDAKYLNMKSFINFFFIIVPLLVWVYSTRYDAFNYHNIKLATLNLCLLNISVYCTRLIFTILLYLFIPFLLYIPLSKEITASMVYTLARTILFLITMATFIVIESNIYKLTEKDIIRSTIISVRFRQLVDLRKDRQFNYDMKIIRKLDDGSDVVIKEQDRTLHTLIDGTTGTGKTSSCMTTSIADDLDQKIHNETHLKKELKKMLKEGKVHIVKPFDDAEFNINYFKAAEGHEKLFYDLSIKCKSCGITLLAPNASLADDICELASARGLKVNRIDPALNGDGKRKPDFIGFNPLYIPKNLPPLQRTIEIVNKARAFADVMQALYDMNGSKDAYFSSLNRNLTSCISILIMLTYPLLNNGRQPMLTDVQDVINDFTRAKIYNDKLKTIMNDPQITDSQRGFSNTTFKFVTDLVDVDLIGPGSEKLMEQARGLRTQISEFLMNPLFKSALCPDATVDMDKMLSEGQVTIVNYALELGRADAIAFGLFFVLNFNNAVIRRPESTRIPHFYYIDEFPVLLHPSLEQCFTLFRQYQVAMSVAIQTLDQMNRTEATKYLKSVLQGNCATQIIFGRVSTAEMEFYEKLGGMKQDYIEQETVSQTALSSENPAQSYSIRLTPQDVPVIKGTTMRELQFQEVTVFTVNEGSPLQPFYGKVSFLKKSKKLYRERYKADWSGYLPQPASECRDVAGGNTEREAVLRPFNDIATSGTVIHFKDAAQHGTESMPTHPFRNGTIYNMVTPNDAVAGREEERATETGRNHDEPQSSQTPDSIQTDAINGQNEADDNIIGRL